MTKLKKLPIGIQTFADIREDDYLYVDKTAAIERLVAGGRYYFLSRPRRFGKSLLISTLQALFEGREELFRGLAIHDQWDWTVKYPVIKISFGGVARDLTDMKQDVIGILEENQHRLNITCKKPEDIGNCFKQLIMDCHEKYGQKVVILVDEYDKLIVDNLDQIEVAKQGREVLKDLYTTIKDSDQYIKFAFLTGVSKFSKVSVFSGLNNLEDISLSSKYATICGYTQNDLETTFVDHLRGVDMDKVRQWYNGYNFLGEPVYNPFDILLFIRNDKVYKNYWFATGTPTFLIKLIQRNNYYIPQLDNLRVSESLIDSFDIEDIELEPILFQAGYLTIKSAEITDFGYELLLGFPNREVAMSFNDILISYLTATSNTLPLKKELLTSLKSADMDNLEATIRALFAAIPYNNHVKNPIGKYEGYYASVIYAYLASLGLDLIPEDVTNRGRIDLTVKMDEVIYIIEFKVDAAGDNIGKALQQIKDKNYQEKYLADGRSIYLIGIDFDAKKRAVANFDWEVV
ncbi:MAG: ATP-binding protein [Thermodesulfobacteriota bacterium]|nr:ATP-binding protein [Thermodesulfobacteriota bacterium]